MSEQLSLQSILPILPKFAAIRNEKNAAFRQRATEIEIALVGLATGELSARLTLGKPIDMACFSE